MKRFVLLSLILTVTLIAFVSCGKQTDTSGDGNKNETGDFIFTEDSVITLVVPTDLAEDNLKLLTDALQVLGEYELSSTSNKQAEHEIVIGPTSREVSLEAYRRLAMQDRVGSSELGYIIYSDGKSVALAYDDELYGLNIAESAAISYFAEKYLSEKSLKLNAGYSESAVFDALEYQREKDEVFKEERWESARAKLEKLGGAQLADEIIESLKRYYALSDTERVVSWLADLYDAETGGFYYSNSGRNTEGFLPDLESTYQAIGFLETSGLAAWVGGIDNLFSDEMKAQIVRWVKGLQDPETGYFYHPQWGKATTDQAVSRRGRDLNWAENLLNRFGDAPTYTTPNGVQGNGIGADGKPVASPSSLKSRFSEVSPVSAVSKVIMVNDPDAGVAEHLKNDKNFIAYLNGLGINDTDRSYPVGNTLESQAPQIVARDKVLKARGEKYSLVEILYDFLNEHQNKETGLWEADGSTDYAANDGLMKIGSTYLKIGKPIPNVDKAIKTAISCITSDEVPGSVCDVFNTWAAASFCMTSMETYSSSDPAMMKTLSETKQYVLENAPMLIDATMEKYALFVKADGSYSFTKEATSHTSQGMVVAVEGTNEGDVNATCISILSVPGTIYSILGINRVRHCSAGDMLKFCLTLEEQGSIIKTHVDDEREDTTRSLAANRIPTALSLQ